jgi:hypothetical protein
MFFSIRERGPRCMITKQQMINISLPRKEKCGVKTKFQITESLHKPARLHMLITLEVYKM